VVELLLNRRTTWGVTRYLVRWRGHTPADDTWLLMEEPLHCPEKVAEYEVSLAARPERAGAAAPRQPPAPAPVVPAPLLAPAGFRLAPGLDRSISHVVGYASSSSLGAGAVDILLDAASHGQAAGGRWHLLVRSPGPARLPCPASGWGVTRVCATRRG
jgi:hypothetical protein